MLNVLELISFLVLELILWKNNNLHRNKKKYIHMMWNLNFLSEREGQLFHGHPSVLTLLHAGAWVHRAGVQMRPSLRQSSPPCFPSFVPEMSLSESRAKQMHPFPPPKSVNQVASASANCKPTDTVPPKLTESNGDLFIYSLIIYGLSPPKKDLSASRDVLAPPPPKV